MRSAPARVDDWWEAVTATNTEMSTNASLCEHFQTGTEWYFESIRAAEGFTHSDAGVSSCRV